MRVDKKTCTDQHIIPMLCPVLFTSNLADIMQVLLSEFQDLQLAITLAPVQRWVQMRGGGELSWVILTR